MRRLPQTLLAAAACVLVGLFVAIAGQSTAAAEEVTTRSIVLPFSPTISGGDGTATVRVPVPPGTVARSLAGRIESTYTAPGSIVVTVSGRQVAQVSATNGGRFQANLRPGDVVDGAVTISVLARLDPAADCLAGYGETATVRDARIVVDLPSEGAGTIGGFLSAGATSITVAIRPGASDAEREAALNAVAALTHRFGTTTEVRMVVADGDPVVTALDRWVIVESSDDPDASDLGGVLDLGPDGALRVTGVESALTPAAWALADPALAVVSASRLTQVSATPDWSPAVGETPLADIGVGAIAVSVIGRQDIVVPISQSAFGGPLSELAISLRGATTPIVRGATGAVTVLWNGEPVQTVPMSARTTMSIDFTVAAGDLERTNELGLSVSYYPPGNDCSLSLLPARVEIDPVASTVTPTYGDSVRPGFERFPQVLGPTVPVALGDAGAPDDLVAQAGDFVAGLQALMPEQLAVSLVSVAEMAGLAASGVVVGAGDGQLAELGSPFAENQILLVRDPLAFADIEALEPLALGVAFQVGDRDLAVFFPEPSDPANPGGRAAAELADELALRVATDPAGWGILLEQVTVLDDLGAVTVVALPNRQENRELGPSPNVLVVLAALLTIVIVIAVVAWSLRRPSRPAPSIPGSPDSGAQGGPP